MKTQIISQPTDFKKWMSHCRDIFSLDTECTSLNRLDLEIIGFSICDGVQACYVVLKNPILYPPLNHKKELLMILDFYISEAKMVVFHNASFDMLVLRKEGIEI